jgi:hypothetical protein
MIHVMVKTEKMGMRKAWYLGAVVRSVVFNTGVIDRTFGIVVYKNNDDGSFWEVEIERLHLDTTFRNDTSVVPENSLRDINLKLKESKK